MSASGPIQEESFERRFDAGTWRRVFGFALAYPRTLVWVAIAAVLAGTCDSLFPLVTRAAIDRVAAEGKAADLTPLVAAYALLTGVLCVSVRAFIGLAGRVATHVAHDVRQAAFGNLQDLSFSFFDRRPVGWLMARMTSDCDRLSRIVAWGFLDVAWASTVLVGTAIVLFTLAPRLAFCIFGMTPLLVWVSAVFQKRILATARVVRKTNSRLTAAYNESLIGVRTTKVLGREEAALGDFQVLSREMHRASIKNALLGSVYLPIVLSIASLGAGLALIAGGHGVASGGMSLGTLIAFLTYSSFLIEPIQDVARCFAELQMAQASAERVVGLIEAVPEVRDGAGVGSGSPALAEPERIGAIEFRDVSFAYADGSPVLDRVSFTAGAGETVALVGPTGGGKTTIMSLLCRFYEPTSGSIRIGGVDYRERRLGWLQSRLAVVLQTPHLFRGSVRDNIRYGRLDASDAEVEAAAREVDAHDFISGLERGYDTEVGEGGSRLSTGQKQLVTFARAVLARPQILVMDEATSSIDTETERRIQQALPRVLAGPTSFLIAHRLSTIRSADRILVVEGGRIVESGSHPELLALGGRYHELYASQRVREAIAGGAAREELEVSGRAEVRGEAADAWAQVRGGAADA